MKLVSVIIPTFNSTNFASQLCESLLGQTYDHLEIIVVDNFSSDKTLNEIKKNINKDKRFKFFQIDNKGIIAKSRNYGITQSSGEYIAFHDSDDFWYKKKIQTSLEYLKSNDFTYHHMLTQNKNNFFLNNKKLFSYQLSNQPFIDLMTIGNPISTSSVVCKKSIFLNNNFFSEDKKLTAVEDFNCWLDLSIKKIKFKEIPIILGKYHLGISNTSTKIKNFNKYKILNIFNKKKHLLNFNQKIFAKNHFRYLFANDINKNNLKIKFYYYLLLQKNIKISKIKLLIKILYYLIRKIL